MEISKGDFRAWFESDITQAFLKDCMTAIDQELAWLGTEAGKDPILDSKRTGIILGLQGLVDWEPKFAEEGTDATDR